MDRKVYIWLYNHKSLYQFSGVDAIKIQLRLNALFGADPNLDSAESCASAKEIYDAFTDALYNNICGYEHGLADEGITCTNLDGYLVSTADGMVPIGYYKENRPVEAAVIVQRYVAQCEEEIHSEKDQLIDGWQARIEKVRAYYEALPKVKVYGVVKSMTTLVASAILFLNLLISFIMVSGFRIFGEEYDTKIKTNFMAVVRERIGCLGRATEGGIKAFSVLVFIFMLLALGAGIYALLALRVAKKKSTTTDLLEHADDVVEHVEQEVQASIQNNEQTIQAAVRQGRSLELAQNANAVRIKDMEHKLFISESFMHCKKIYVHISVMFVVLGLLACSVVIHTNWIPRLEDGRVYDEAVQLMSKKNYEQASELFAQLGDYKDAASLQMECDYYDAKAYLDTDRYKLAREKFVALKDYKDSKSLVMECDYRIAKKLRRNGDLTDAYDAFISLGTYKDASEQAKKMKPELYSRGVSFYSSGLYESALSNFERALDYENAADYALLVSAHLGTIEDVSALYPLIDFEDTQELLLSDACIKQFLMGRWSSGKTYLEYFESSDGELQVAHNIEINSDTDCKLEDKKHFALRYGNWTAQWDFEFVSIDSIKVISREDDRVYTLHRN